jgi:CRISPR-associated protein Cas1
MKKDYFVFSPGRVKRSNNTFYFIDKEDKKKSLPIHQIDNIFVFGTLDMNTEFLEMLNQHDVALHIFNYYGFYSGSFFPRRKKVSGFTVIHQSRNYLEHEKRIFLAKQFVISATFHMLRNLRHYKNKDNVQITIDAMQKLQSQIDAAKTIQEVMGVEGTIRQHYYSAFNSFLSPDFAFDERTKRPPKDPLNALISFGNSLCYTKVLAEIYKTHLDPTISFLHEPSTKRFSLSLDLAEIFKPLMVDPVIFTLINKKQLNPAHDFEYLEEMVLLNEQGRKKFIKEWSEKLKTTIRHRKLNRNVSYQYFIRLECYKLIKHFIEDEEYKPLKAWW